ncbi:MAG: LbtU family siderophore porin [Thermodesulfobacteriota bacterium]|nr:LbtU family siderophore porin [Thermodesulfobacteriota bacterium]
MKKPVWRLVGVLCVLGLFAVVNSGHAMQEHVGEVLSDIHFSGLIEVGGAWQDFDYDEGGSDDASDLCLTTLELEAEAEINEWVSVAALLLYEDATSFEGENDETDVDIEEATVTIGNPDEYPYYLTAGKMVVPFGALFTHFPDDPLMDVPVTLVMGETIEKAVLVGATCPLGFTLSGYVFSGDVDEDEDNNVESYGLDVNYAMEDEEGLDLLIGASYISNIADSDVIEETLEHHGVEEIEDYVDGFDLYFLADWAGFFLGAEYMTALDDFDHDELHTAGGDGAEPEVWNIEAGYNLEWGRNLEIALKYAGSDEAEGLDIPEDRYGLCLNQEIWEGVVGSVAYLHDEYENDDERDVLYGQIAVEF